jgi:hypothetical protein
MGLGALFGDLFFGGNSRKDRHQITDVYSLLNQEAKSATAAGESAVGDSLAYYKKLLSGDPAAQASAIAPVTNAVAGQQQQQKQALSSEGTARGGGVNAAVQQTGDAASKAAVDALTSLAPGAAGQEASVGGATAGRGLGAATSLGNLAEEERRTNLAHQGAEGDALSSAIAAFFPPAKAATAPQAPALNVPTLEMPLPSSIPLVGVPEFPA